MKPVRIPSNAGAEPASPVAAPQSRPADAFRPVHLLGLAVGAAALALTWAAHVNDRPITSALVALFGVMAVGALLGIRAGAIAGLAASLTFNLLFTDPPGTFTYSTADDLVPMIALTLSAVGAGMIAGRLRDRAIAAETATRKLAELLRFSEDLQRAVTLADVERIARTYVVGRRADVQLFVERGGELSCSSLLAWGTDAARECWDSALPSLATGNSTAFLLKSADRRIGVLVVEDDPAIATDVRLFLPLVALAIQRCQLAEEVARSDLVRRSEQFKTALLSSVSHDLRTPLAAISASASSLATLGDALDPGTRSELLASIEEQCDRLDRFTRNLLNLGRIEAGINLSTMPLIDALEVLGGALARVRPTAGPRPIERDFRVSSAPVRADESLLEQLFLNVLENAVAHTPAGTAMKVEAGISEGFLLVAVEDNGPGIPVPERERVFERFHQVAAGGPGAGGSGLGLSIANGFTELFGGTIAAADARPPMHGARIEIRLPLGDLVG